MSVDTLKYSNLLKQHGVTPDQAEGAVKVLKEAVEDSDLVTKSDLQIEVGKLKNFIIAVNGVTIAILAVILPIMLEVILK